MCGIFGLVAQPQLTTDGRTLRRLLEQLFRLSESRGKEASGLAVHDGSTLQVLKREVPASKLLRSRELRRLLASTLTPWMRSPSQPLALIGHSRLVTNGSEAQHENNQPVVAHGAVGIHNGIVLNDAELWRQLDGRERLAEVDSEVIFASIRDGLDRGQPLSAALLDTFERIEGQASIAALFADQPTLALFTNHGSLYTTGTADGALVLFASERYFLEKVEDLLQPVFHSHGGASTRGKERIAPGSGRLVRLDGGTIEQIGPETGAAAGAMVERPEAKSDPAAGPNQGMAIEIIDLGAPPPGPAPAVAGPAKVPADIERDFERCRRAVAQLERCSRCVLPVTMPFLELDSEGVCNFCRGYRRIELKPRAELDSALESTRRAGGRCVVGLSGGRDSSYALHLLRHELELDPVAFTYDWGMVTDLARRNISRLCGSLGVEHILVSADIRAKRANIRRNVSAWLRRPDLGTVPLFMAGDKRYFVHAGRVRRQLGVELTFLGENLLERTDFKTGYAGVAPARVDEDRVYVLPWIDTLRLPAYYASRFLANPRYINRSLFDTAAGFWAYYGIDRDYVNLFRYFPWREEVVDETLSTAYGWEHAHDAVSTWRIGDGTAPFYNVIYHVAGGFSEVETFRSNQIRQGHLERDQALALIERDNRPRYDSIREYCRLIGVDWIEALRTIHRMPKSYDFA